MLSAQPEIDCCIEIVSFFWFSARNAQWSTLAEYPTKGKFFRAAEVWGLPRRQTDCLFVSWTSACLFEAFPFQPLDLSSTFHSIAGHDSLQRWIGPTGRPWRAIRLPGVNFLAQSFLRSEHQVKSSQRPQYLYLSTGWRTLKLFGPHPDAPCSWYTCCFL